MASGPGVSAACDALDMLLGAGVDVRLWTTPPDFSGAGGVEVSGGGYAAASLGFNAAEPTGGAQIARATSSGGLLFIELPVASSAVSAITLHDQTTGDVVWFDDSWTAPSPWSAGDSPMFPAGSFSVAFVPVS